MLEYLELVNFRAFKRQAFRFGKLNVFVGPNNSGKSSVLSALNVLAQTTRPIGSNSSPLVLNGPYDELGTFKDAVHGNRANTPMRFSLKLDEFSCEIEYKYRPQRREINISKYRLTKSSKPIFDFAIKKDGYDLDISGKSMESLGLSKKREPTFHGLVPEIYFLAESEKRSIERNSDAVETAERNIMRFRSALWRTFFEYESISPFRMQPQRTYLFSGETTDRIGRNGENTITMLAGDASRRGSEKVGYIDSISKWLRATGISDGLKVKHLTDRHFEICVIGRDGTEHNICDVGFGVSQVLPVLAAGISFSAQETMFQNSLMVVQEPEIHLHPNAQAELGTFFAAMCQGSGQIFVETHSDSFVLRMARHVASGDLDASDVFFYYVEDTPAGRTIKQMRIDEFGSFHPEWPGGFFPQRQQESMALAKAAFARSNNQEIPQLDLFEF